MTTCPLRFLSAATAALSLVLALTLSGCSKSTSLENLPPIEVEGVQVDTPQLMAAFADVSPDLYSKVEDASTNIRYKKYVDAMMGFDAVLKTPGLKPHQQQILTKVIGQLKQVIGKVPPESKQ